MRIIAIVICAISLVIIPDSVLEWIFETGFEAASYIGHKILEAGLNLLK